MKNNSGCEWGQTDCKFEGSNKCMSCILESQNYKPVQIKQRKGLARVQQKADKRMGSSFEYRNHKINQSVLKDDVVTSMTLNSGATILQKGDEQIRGLVNIMEEDKTRVVIQAPGKKTFTIQKKWLDKLLKESEKEGMDFHYLKFAFHEYDQDIYVITELEQIMSWVKTLVQDRRAAKKAEYQKEIANKKVEQLRAENSALMAKLDYYEKKEEFMNFLKEEGLSNDDYRGKDSSAC